MNQMTSVWVVLFLTLFVSGCSLFPTKTEVINVIPPTAPLQATPVPPFNGRVYSDLLDTYIPDLIGTIKQCNLDKNAVLTFVNEKTKSE